VFRKYTRLVLLAAVAAALGLGPMLSAFASGPVVDVVDDQFHYTNNTNSTDAYVGDDITWRVASDAQHPHTVTPYDPKQWGDKGGSADLTAGQEYTVHFSKPGRYVYYCTHHGGGDKLHPTGMWGVINVIDPNAPPPTTPSTAAPTTTTTTAPPTTTPTTPPGTTAPTTPTTAAPGGGHTPTTAAPATTTTAKDKKPKEDTSSSSTTTAPPPPVDLPDSAIIPTLPLFGTTTSTLIQNGATAQAPASVPQGDAVAMLPEQHHRAGTKMLILTGVGLGALGFGTAGWKFAHRSSKYFPA
jgi:plastocyanin